MQTKSLYAAIDLGSNSFRLEIGQMDAGQLRRVEYIKETVRQGNGLDVFGERIVGQAVPGHDHAEIEGTFMPGLGPADPGQRRQGGEAGKDGAAVGASGHGGTFQKTGAGRVPYPTRRRWA